MRNEYGEPNRMITPYIIKFMWDNGAYHKYTPEEIAEGIGEPYTKVRQALIDMKNKSPYIMLWDKEGYQTYYMLAIRNYKRLQRKVGKAGLKLNPYLDPYRYY